MTLYEELGVPPDAPPETIRDAYRKVARLLHPDLQTDPGLKESADAQMKRINHLYSILSHPERRHRYDQELALAAERSAPIFILAPPPENRFQPRNESALVWLAATALCATFIVWLAARESSSTPAVYPLQSFPPPTTGSRSPIAAKMAARPRTPAAGSTSTAIPARTEPAPQHDEQLAALRGQLLAANTDREGLARQIAARQADRTAAEPSTVPLVAPQSTAELSLPAVLRPVAAPPVPVKPPNPPNSQPAAAATIPGTRWSGSWIYHRASSGNKDKGLFPPEFIETVITEEKGRIRGQYHARFQVADPGISPQVDFRFEGKVSGPSGQFPWTGPGGAKGEVKLRLVSDATIEIIWSATSLGKSMGLASGTAVLNRKN
jgi:curved DNA-binding protein CbpA